MIDRRRFLHNLGLGCATVGAACAAPITTGSTVAVPQPEPPPVPPGEFAKPPGGSADVDRWRDALAAARLREVARLRDYRVAGRFPQNHRIFGRVPTFIDERGTPCAVGYLMQRSGRSELAAEISRTNNHVYVEKIADGPALDWILHSGLTQEECATIQPSYGWRDPPKRLPMPLPPDEDDERQQLVLHFASLEQHLLRDSETSLDAALARLAPQIRRGDPIARVIR